MSYDFEQRDSAGVDDVTPITSHRAQSSYGTFYSVPSKSERSPSRPASIFNSFRVLSITYGVLAILSFVLRLLNVFHLVGELNNDGVNVGQVMSLHTVMAQVWMVDYTTTTLGFVLFIWMEEQIWWKCWGWLAVFVFSPSVGLPWYLWAREHRLQRPHLFASLLRNPTDETDHAI